MDGTDITDWIGTALRLGGFLLVVPAGVLWYRNSLGDAERRRSAGLSPETPPGQVQRARLQQAVDDGPGDADLVDLRLQATTLRKNRSTLLFFVAGLVLQLGAVITSPSLGRVAFAGLFALIVAPAIIRIERNARTAEAFLRRYPEHTGAQTSGGG